MPPSAAFFLTATLADENPGKKNAPAEPGQNDTR